MGYWKKDEVTAGDTDTFCSPYVYLYQAWNADDYDGNTAKDGLVWTLDDAYQYGYINGYKLTFYEMDDDLGCTNLLSDFTDWRNGYDQTQSGFHILANDCSQENVSSGAQDGANAWETDSSGQATRAASGGGSKDDARFRNSNAHEMIHAFVLGSCNYVDNMIEQSEHDLGKVYDNNDVSPIGDSNSSDRGTCSSSLNRHDDRTEPTNCSIKAIKYSANHTYGGHDMDHCQ